MPKFTLLIKKLRVIISYLFQRYVPFEISVSNL